MRKNSNLVYFKHSKTARLFVDTSASETLDTFTLERVGLGHLTEMTSFVWFFDTPFCLWLWAASHIGSQRQDG